MGNEEEQLVSLLLSKGAAESALADEMGRLRVQEDVRILFCTCCLLSHRFCTCQPFLDAA